MDTIYDALRNAKAEMFGHGPNLYVRETEMTQELLIDWAYSNKIDPFKSHKEEMHGKMWIVLKDAWDPYWENQAALRLAA
jgi:hypothetical protein